MRMKPGVVVWGVNLGIDRRTRAGVIIASWILGGRALARVELAIAPWKGCVAARQSWQRLNRLLEQMPARPEQTRWC